MKRMLIAATLAALTFAAQGQPGPGKGPHWNADNTPGWSMMTAEERKAHQDKMASMKDPAECGKYMDEHHKTMEERAKAKGQKLPMMAGKHGCDMMMSK